MSVELAKVPAQVGSIGADGSEEPSLLRGIRFSDLYLEADGRAWFKRSPRDRECLALSGAEVAEALVLRDFVEAQNRETDFRVTWRGVDMRAARLHTVEGPVLVLRRLLPEPMRFDQLGFPSRLSSDLMSSKFLRGGLVLFVGSTGAGKSTSLASWLVGRLRCFGGTAWTVENPAEVALQGRYEEGNAIGTCYQIEDEEHNFGARVRDIMRAAPNIIMLGEIRSPATAAQAILAGTSGTLVGATLHGNDVKTGLERLRAMLREAKFDDGLLADGLAAIVHQSMEVSGTGKDQRRVLRVSPLLVTGAPNEIGVRAHLRSSQLVQLSSELELQARTYR